MGIGMMLGLILAGLAALSYVPLQALSPVTQVLGAQGTLQFAYPSGNSPITAVHFELPAELAGSIRVSQISSGWQHQRAGNTLSLSGGSLEPGQPINIDFAYVQYVQPGELPLKVSATTAEGAPVQAVGAIVV